MWVCGVYVWKDRVRSSEWSDSLVFISLYDVVLVALSVHCRVVIVLVQQVPQSLLVGGLM